MANDDVITFRDRSDAGKLLAAKLEKYRNTDSIVLAIPRGGLPVGYEIARTLNLPLDIALAKKIGHPLNPEVAIGAVTLDDVQHGDYDDVSQEYIAKKVEELREALAAKASLYRRNIRELNPQGKTVIITDDGIATGHTLHATLRAVRKKNPEKIVVAVPVAPIREETIAREADEYICLVNADYFPGVGAFYADFGQVTDEEAIRLLERANHVE